MRAELVAIFEHTRSQKQVRGAVGHWRDVASSGRSYYESAGVKVKEMLRRIMYYSLSMSLNQWRQESALLNEAAARVGSALYRMRQQKVTAAFLTWRGKVAEMRWQQEIMTKALKRFTNRLLARALGHWRLVVAAVASLGERCQASLSIWLNGTLWRGLEVWRQEAGTVRAGDEAGVRPGVVQVRSLWLNGIWERQRRLLMRNVIYHIQVTRGCQSPSSHTHD